jgi:hypothetical protein
MVTEMTGLRQQISEGEGGPRERWKKSERSDADASIKVDVRTAVGAVEMWKSGAFGRISKRGGKSGKLAF